MLVVDMQVGLLNGEPLAIDIINEFSIFRGVPTSLPTNKNAGPKPRPFLDHRDWKAAPALS